jgi:hypothetical protein
MEYSKSEWDLLLWPHSWHKRMNTALMTLIPCILWVGLFDVLGATNSILSDFIINSSTDIAVKIFLFLITVVIIGLFDIFCFAWPIADLCRYIAKRTEKFIVPGFNIIFMKSYAYSHLPFMPLLLLSSPAAVDLMDLSRNPAFYAKALFFVLVILLNTQQYWQIGIMLRTIGVKSKILFSGKLVIAIAIVVWSYFIGYAVFSLVNMAYKAFGFLFGS